MSSSSGRSSLQTRRRETEICILGLVAEDRFIEAQEMWQEHGRRGGYDRQLTRLPRPAVGMSGGIEQPAGL